MRSVSAGGGTGRDVSSAGRCGAGVARNSDCREGFDLSSGERARPGSAVLRGLVVRSVSTGGGFRGCTIVSKGSALLVCPGSAIHRGGAHDVSSGERARPGSAVLRGLVVRSVSAGGGTRVRTIVIKRRYAAALPHNRIHRAGAHVRCGKQASPCASVLRGLVVSSVSAADSGVHHRHQEAVRCCSAPQQDPQGWCTCALSQAGIPMRLRPERTRGAHIYISYKVGLLAARRP